jgi:hypothetical protein
MFMVAILKFAGDPKTYDVNNTIASVVTDWMRANITEDEMLVFLHQFKTIHESGIPSVLFMKDIFSGTMFETSLWFLEYGVGRHQGH